LPGADIGAAGSVWVDLEDTYGTVKDPSVGVNEAGGLYVPIISESLAYTEPDRYYSEQIRHEAVHSDVKPSYYHVEGDIVLECDAKYLPLFLAASRHTTLQTGAGANQLYTITPSRTGATYPGGAARGLSIGIIRNAVGFVYSGCVVNQAAFTLENGIGRVTLSMLGLAEQNMADVTTLDPQFADPNLFGADAHAIYVDASGTAPAFAAPDATFNGYTFTINHNGEPQNRVIRERSASYVKYGITEISFDTELDFLSRAEYDNYKAASFKAYRFESIYPGGAGGTWAAATQGYRITCYKAVYGTYEIGLSGMGDLVMARTAGRVLGGLAGADAYKIEIKSPTDLTLPPLTT
jgi:hypothetical protein